MPLAFHAAPPAGHWINDPNGLVFADDKWRLFAQHRADAPAFKATGWAAFSSTDLLDWRFDGAAIPPEGDAWAYSGSVIADGDRLEAIHTRHQGGLEEQVFRTSTDGGRHWNTVAPLPSLGAPARNRRDPFVFARDGAWWMLLAEPCDWTGWRSDPPSRIGVYRAPDRRAWAWVGTIGPWDPVGVMWEVPVLARIGECDVLFISKVDRRGDMVDCWVTGTIGAFDDGVFTPLPGQSESRVDLGPDFYALMTSASDPALAVGWLSNWRNARAMPWPGFAGGPISLPRTLEIDVTPDGPRLGMRLPRTLADRFRVPSVHVPVAGLGSAEIALGQQSTLSIASETASLDVTIDAPANRVAVRRSGAATLDMASKFEVSFHGSERSALHIAIDGPVIEIFIDRPGIAISAALPSDGAPLRVTLTAPQARPIAWHTVSPHDER